MARLTPLRVAHPPSGVGVAFSPDRSSAVTDADVAPE
jgi:hypothetical protein